MRSSKRRAITLLCFLMAISLIGSVFIFMDSISLDKWNEYQDIGPVAMRINGENLDSVINEISNTSHVTVASKTMTAKAYIRMDQNSIFTGSPTDPLNPVFLLVGQAYSFNSDFIESFPSEFTLTAGRYPQNSSEIAISKADADYWGIPLGRMLNYSHQLNSEKRTVFAVGFFEVSSDPLRSVVTDAVAIVTSEVLNPETVKTKVYIDVDRSLITPVDPRGSLRLLREIEGTLAGINPSSSVFDRYYIEDYLATSVESYIDYITIERNRQLSRVQLLIIISGMFVFLGTRFNFSMREDEISMLKMRGASRFQCTRKYLSELFVISVVASILSIILASLFSSFGWTSTGYLTFDWSQISEMQLVLTYDTLFLVASLGIALPFLGYLGNHLVSSITTREVESRKLARLMRGIQLVRWDFSVIIIVALLLSSLYLGGNLVSENPLISLLASYSIIPLFLAIASLLTKSLRMIVQLMSKGFRHIIGRIPANIGVRGLGTNNKITIPVILILTVVLSSCLVHDAVANSMPTTQSIHSKYLIGGDLSFHLDMDELALWDSFDQEILNQTEVLETSLVSVGTLSLSDGPAGVVDFVAVNPEEYLNVGYDSTGIILDKSSQKKYLADLSSNHEGAVLTEDIASEYNLIPGDTLRVFSIGETTGTVEFNVLGITNSIPRPIISGQPIDDLIVGTRKIWVTRQYIDNKVDLNSTTSTFLCVKTAEETNNTEVGLKVLGEFGTQVLLSGEWSSSTADKDAYTAQESFVIDRSIDSMLTISMLFSVVFALIPYHTFHRYENRGEQALLKSIGFSENQLLKVKLADSLTIVLVSLFLVASFGLLNMTNILRISVLEYSIWSYTFPVSFFNSINWISYFIIVIGFVIPLSIIMAYISKRGERGNPGTILRDILQIGRVTEEIA